MPQWEKGKLLPLHELLSLTGYKSQTGKHHWFKISQQHLTTGLISSWEYESFCSSLLLQNKPSPPFQQLSDQNTASVQKALNGILIHHFLSFFFPPPPNWWILITQSTDLHRSISVFRRILCKSEEISLFCNGEETECQSDLWTFLSRQCSC